MLEKIYIAVGVPGEVKRLVIAPLTIQEFNRDEIKEVFCEAIDAIYDTAEESYLTSGGEDEPTFHDISNA